MSNYDRNVVIPGAPVDQTFAVDAGLRAHMLRVYNYMATGVGLTGLVAMLTYQFTGPELLQSPLVLDDLANARLLQEPRAGDCPRSLLFQRPAHLTKVAAGSFT